MSQTLYGKSMTNVFKYTNASKRLEVLILVDIYANIHVILFYLFVDHLARMYSMLLVASPVKGRAKRVNKMVKDVR
jgi:hypothetical protein